MRIRESVSEGGKEGERDGERLSDLNERENTDRKKKCSYKNYNVLHV